MKKALDISRHQTAYNAAVTKARGINTVLCRAAYAASKDSTFDAYAKKTLDAGMNLGAYGFATWHYTTVNGGNVDAARVAMQSQTNYWAQLARAAGVNSWFGIDLELEQGKSCGLNKDALTALANEAADILKAAGLHPVIYASVSWFLERMDVSALKYPLWVARYYWHPNDPDFSGANNGVMPGTGAYTQAVQSWGDRVVMWQFGSVGYASTYGITHGSNSVDRDWLYSEPAETAAPDNSAASRAVDGLQTLNIGPASAGDQKTILQLAESLCVPATIWDDGSIVVGPLSKGDQAAFFTLADKLLLPCAFCFNAGNDNPGTASGGDQPTNTPAQPDTPAQGENNGPQGPCGNSKYRMPFDGQQRITSPYGMRTLNGKTAMHKGLDIVADEDTHVRAVIGGVVKSSTIVTDHSNSTWEWGNYVKILGDDGLYWFYCHMASRAVSVGQRVAPGDILGVMGNTGYSFGAHTHLEVRNAANTSLNTAQVLGIENKKYTLYQPAEPDERTITATSLNVRTGPGTNFGRVDLLYNGDTVTISEIHDNWGFVSGMGWISLSYTKQL